MFVSVTVILSEKMCRLLLYILLVSLFGFGCRGQKASVLVAESENISFADLPLEVKVQYEKSLAPKLRIEKGDTFRDYSKGDQFYCLCERKNCRIEHVFKASFLVKHLFYIDDGVWELPFNYNAESPPYILCGNKLYFVRTSNVITSKELHQAIFGYMLVHGLKDCPAPPTKNP